RCGDVVLAALEQSNIGELLVSRGQFDEAMPVLAEAVRTHRAIGFLEGALFDEVQLGRLATGRGELDQAIELLTAVRDEANGLHLPGSALEASIHLATALVDSGRPDEALDVVDAAAEAAAEETQVFAASVALARARALAASGRLVDAYEVVTAGIDAARQMGIVYELGWLLMLRADVGQRLDRGAPTTEGAEGRALLDKLKVTARH
ncbi:MAG TPA: tetratricopeptide repeat protein, partial [Acidimicrobiia bacterium]